MQAEGAVAWPAPQILDLHSWLTEQWKSLLLTGTEDRLLLNELQERALWERLIAPVITKFSLVEPARMAQLAHDALWAAGELPQPGPAERFDVDGRSIRRA